MKHNTDFRSLDSEAVRRHARKGRRTVPAAEAEPRKRVAHRAERAGARPGSDKAMQVLSGRYGPTSPTDIRVAAEERRPGDDHHRRGGGTAQGAGSHGAVPEEERARPAVRRPRPAAPASEPDPPCPSNPSSRSSGRLAGSEAAWQVASRGVRVVPRDAAGADRGAQDRGCAELVCSNSFRGDKLDNAVGLLKEEMRRLGSLIMQAAETARVPAGARWRSTAIASRPR